MRERVQVAFVADVGSRKRDIRERVRVALATGFYYSGLVKLALWWKWRSGPYLIILNYHRATEEGGNLRAQMQFLRRHFRVLHLEEALEEFYAPSASASKARSQRARRAPVVLTFDDGYLDNYTHALRWAKELQVPITIFLAPGYIESGACFWWLAPDYLVKHTKVEKVTISERTYYLAQPADRKALKEAIAAYLRKASTVVERETFLADIQQALEVLLPSRADAVNAPMFTITWEQVREMERSGLVSFGAHTMHHPILSALADSAELRYEVQHCRQVLEQQLGHPVSTFAYPVGKMKDIGEQGIQAVKEAGYRWALTTIEEINTPQTDTLLLRRLPGDITVHWLVMASELAGLLGILSRFRKRKL
ncbi:MAG: polysaccharide deacetylase family protein [Ktedonobacteraceae bacterium]|nr:polysaccharide deacetylase family protein [Ktedonobacteraceae bacterium]